LCRMESNQSYCFAHRCHRQTSGQADERDETRSGYVRPHPGSTFPGWNSWNFLVTKSERSDSASTAILLGLNFARDDATSASSACLAGVRTLSTIILYIS